MGVIQAARKSSALMANQKAVQVERQLEARIVGQQPRYDFRNICWVYPPPRIPVANEGLGWDSRT